MIKNISSLAVTKSLRSYSWYIIFTRAYFWTRLFVLYFSSIVSLKQVFQLEAIYYASVFILEVPSGYFSDFFGRKKTLVISTASLTISYLLFFIGGSFNVFMIAQFFLAIGFSFASGTDTSLHYALLKSIGKESEYGEREARLSSRGLLSIGLAAIIGGLFAFLSEYRVAYALSMIFAFFSFCFVLNMVDPDKIHPEHENPEKPFLQIKKIFVKLNDPTLRYLFVFTIILTILSHIPYELYQIYINDMLESFETFRLSESGPLVLGFHTTLSMVIAAFFAKRSMKFQNIFGTKNALIILTLILSACISIMMIRGSYIIVFLLLLRGMPSAVGSPIVRAGTTHKLSPSLRASYYSVKSLIGRVSFSAVLLLFSLIPGNGFQGSVILGTGLGVLAIALLIIIPINKKK